MSRQLLIRRYFITGLLIWVPLVITLWVLDLLVGIMDQTLLLVPPEWRTESDVLTKDIVERMLRKGPKTDLVEFPGVGHAPALRDAQQIDVIKRWLLA